MNKELLLERAKEFFRDVIVPNHKKNTEKLDNLKEFKINPFLLEYVANFYTGNGSNESKAKALIIPRSLSQSINTSFGQNAQLMITKMFADGSTTSGIDIEFVDKLDNRKKWCQVKLGPNTINKDDIETIIRHFKAVKNLARTNNMDVRTTDLIIGVIYGDRNELSGNYIALNEAYPVFVGEEFWHRLTGDKEFYSDLAKAIGEVASEVDGTKVLSDTVNKLKEKF